jgi:hypothetical protein
MFGTKKCKHKVTTAINTKYDWVRKITCDDCNESWYEWRRFNTKDGLHIVKSDTFPERPDIAPYKVDSDS